MALFKDWIICNGWEFQPFGYRQSIRRLCPILGMISPTIETSIQFLARWKILRNYCNKRISETCIDVLGADGMLFPDGYPMSRPRDAGLFGDNPRTLFLRMRAQSIEGGTSEVMRNILGERVLGLPKSYGETRT